MPEQQQQPQPVQAKKEEKKFGPRQASRVGVELRTSRNRAVETALKTRIGKAEKLMSGGDAEAVKKAIREAVSALDKAAGKGIIHKNQAARRKARLVKKAAKAAAAPAAAPKKTTRKKTTRKTKAK